MKKKLLVLALPIFAGLVLSSCNLLPDMNFGGDEETSQTSSNGGSSSGSDSSDSGSSSSSSSSSSGSQQTVVLDYISVSGSYKTNFYVGDSFTFGGTVKAYYTNGSSKTVTSSAQFAGFNSSAAVANQTITVSYTEKGVTKTTTYSIRINAIVLSSISASGYQTQFCVGDSFSFGGTVTAHYNNGSTKNVTSIAKFSGFNSAAVVANQTITVSYTENAVQKTTTYTISIKESGDSDTIENSAAIKLYYGSGSISGQYAYLTKQTVDIPYMKFRDFYNYFFVPFSEMETVNKVNVDTHAYRFSNSSGYIQIDADQDTIVIHNPSSILSASDKTDNGVPYIADGYETAYCDFNNSSSSLLESQHDITFNLGDYGLNIVYDTNAVYVPLMTLVDMFAGFNGFNIGYNGKDLYYMNAYSESSSQFYTQSPWLNQSTRSATLAEYTYNELCFNIDHFYGLKETREITKIDSIIQSLGYKSNLLSTNTKTYETAMQQFVGAYFCDGHSGYTATSPFQRDLGTSAYTSALYSNEREMNLYSAYYECSGARDSAGKGLGVTFSDNNRTAVIRFDTFMKASDTEGVDVDDYTYDALDENCSYLFFKKAFKEITAKGSTVKNVVIDVSCNGGGMVDSLPYLQAFMTDDPFITYKNTLTGEISDVHYKVDLNQDGTKGGSGDTYKGQYNFYVLTSNYSFSCANAFPTFAKKGGMAKIIGQQSGGGACCVGGFVTASGTNIRSSSCWQFGTYSGGTWTDNDGGVPVDYELPVSSFYNDNTLDTFVNGK